MLNIFNGPSDTVYVHKLRTVAFWALTDVFVVCHCIRELFTVVCIAVCLLVETRQPVAFGSLSEKSSTVFCILCKAVPLHAMEALGGEAI
jgi:hypothetical protein